MKKILVCFIVILLLFLSVIYIFIPGKIEMKDSILVNTNSKGLYRCLANVENWKKLPGNISPLQKNSFIFNDFNFRIGKTLYEGIPVNINDKDFSIITILDCIPTGSDSTAIIWKTSVITDINPVTKLQQYIKATRLKRSINILLNKMKSFAETESNVYGINIQLTKVTDTFLIVTKSYFDKHPSDTIVYSMINMLKEYIAAKGLKEMNPPMLNIRATENSNYETMVAIPINMEIDADGKILFKRMIPGKILVTEVKGGSNTVKQAFAAMDLYMQDHQYTAPAIPFESLVTERIRETDTTKWVTKIYYPIY
jgi:hypothetical protein